MAKRPVFFPSQKKHLLVETKEFEFTWNPGMAVSQKKKNIVALHDSARKELGVHNLLEISTKSEESLGVELSAFNLKFQSKSGTQYTLECLYQASKVFEHGGPYRDLLNGSPKGAKQDPRLKESGNMVKFLSLKGVDWPLFPHTIYYDWLYLNVLKQYPNVLDELTEYDAFTDIEFNPKKSFNCQAYSVALAVSLNHRGMLNQATASKEAYLEYITAHEVNNSAVNTCEEKDLFSS